MNIRLEKPDDETAIHRVNHLAFEREDEPDLVNGLRRGGYARLSLVAEENEEIVGHVLVGEVSVEGLPRALALALVAVVPGRQGEGIGSALIRAGIRTCVAEGYDSIFVFGDPSYYSRFGFSVGAARNFDTPYPREYSMALELRDGALDGAAGEIVFPPPFGGE